MAISRRTFLGGTLAASAVVAGAPLLSHANPMPNRGTRIGDLVGQTDLAIPHGFSSHRITTLGVEPILSGPGGQKVGLTPNDVDGMGVFQHRDGLHLVRNHECSPGGDHPVPLVAGTIYDDALPMGGVSIVETTATGEFKQQWVGLSGTVRNCAGGQTPWGSWLSCEEDTTKAGEVHKSGHKVSKDHGYVFEVFPGYDVTQIPEPITCFGRATFEAICIGPQRQQAYLTEDNKDGLLYRWTAPTGATMRAGLARQFGPNDGTLEAISVINPANGLPFDHFAAIDPVLQGSPLKVRWVKPTGNDRQAQTTPLRQQFKNVTRHPKIEGIWSDGNGCYFICSYTTQAEVDRKVGATRPDQGMLFYYNYAAQHVILKQFFAMGGSFDGPDNVAVTPFNTVIMSEDGDGEQHILSWTKAKGVEAMVRNLVNDCEMTSPNMSPDGRVLFCSIQDTATFAVVGDWKRFY